ncbi:glucosaminidase domain-containing protein [Archangium sp.]|jgi:uncharacterized protein YcbK (DUF882 family)|uniref:glucosaminidase domain-containing protein n=1 Tax=Archangium sp. TaxID=1872627 RepID=UPI002ED8990B
MSNVATQAGSGGLPKTGNAFVDSVSADAVDSQRATGVPASVTLAQAILESNWGKSGLSKKYHNYFGIKGKGSAGTAVMSTGEHFNGKDVVIKDGFRAYRSATESFVDHGRFFIENKRYAEAMRNKDDAERFAQEIHKAGYATDPDYSQKLISLIRKYKLVAFDKYARSLGPLKTGPAPKGSSNETGTSSSNGGKEPSSSNQAVKELQLLLVKYGYLTQQQMQTGPGILGPQTQAAVTRFLEGNAHVTTTSTPGSGVTGTGAVKESTPPKTTPPTTTTTTTSSSSSTSVDTNKLTYAQISKDLKAKIPGARYFTWHDALWLPSFGRHANENEVTPTILSNIARQAKALDRVREHFNKPIVVHCWLRPPAYNKKVGGAKNSAHLRGAATDFHIEGYTADQVRKVLLNDKSIYPGAGELKVTWMHLDLEHKVWFSP